MITTAPAGLRRNRNWRYLWLGQAVSLIGDSVFNVTVMLWVATVIAKGKPWAPTAVSGVLIADSIPILLVGPLAGVWIDRWNRRKTMMTADACRAILVASLLAVPALSAHISAWATLAAIYCTVALESSFAQFFNPSRLALLGQIVHPSDRGRTSGMLQATSSTASIIGPPVAAQLLFTSSIEWALIVNAASFVFSFFAIRAIRPPDPQPETSVQKSSFGSEFIAGLRFFAANKIILGLCLGVIIATLGTGALNTLQIFFIRDDLRTTASWLGTLYAAAGAGAVVGALVGGWIAGLIRSGQDVLPGAYSRWRRTARVLPPQFDFNCCRSRRLRRPYIRRAQRSGAAAIPGKHPATLDRPGHVRLQSVAASRQHYLRGGRRISGGELVARRKAYHRRCHVRADQHHLRNERAADLRSRPSAR